jgi:hypothetical protein
MIRLSAAGMAAGMGSRIGVGGLPMSALRSPLVTSISPRAMPRSQSARIAATGSGRPASTSVCVYRSAGRSWYFTRPARGCADLFGQLAEGERIVASEFVDLSGLVIPEQHYCGGLGVVGPGGDADAAVVGAAEHCALQVGGELVGVVFEVPAVAEQHEWHTGITQGCSVA